MIRRWLRRLFRRHDPNANSWNAWLIPEENWREDIVPDADATYDAVTRAHALEAFHRGIDLNDGH